MSPKQIEQHAARMRLDSSERRLDELMKRIKNHAEPDRRRQLREFWDQIRKDQETAGFNVR